MKNIERLKKYQPLVSIIIPTYNREKFLPFAIDSVLNQSYSKWELIIVDDRSKDNTKELIQKYISRDKRIKYILNKKIKGDCGARSQGIENSKGKYIAFLDSDDLWIVPDKLKKQIEFLENNPDYDLVYTDIRMIDEQGNIIEETPFYKKQKKKYKSGYVFFDFLKRNNFINTLTVCVRKRVLITERIVQDMDWFVVDYWIWLRIAMKSKFSFIDKKTAAYRVHQNSISFGTDSIPKYPNSISDIILYFTKYNRKRINEEEKIILLKTSYSLLKNKQIKFFRRLMLIMVMLKYSFPFKNVILKFIRK